MGLAELCFIAVGLSMDAFAVAVGKGLTFRTWNVRHALCVAICFGAFQALMPLLGWLLGSTFASYVEAVDHWIAFVLLALIGVNMIREAYRVSLDSRSSNPTNTGDVGESFKLNWRELILLGVATSIDAFAVGITFSFMQANIVFAAIFIGVVTCALSFGGVAMGQRFGARWRTPASIAGGIILIGIGVRILLEHLL